MQLDRRTVLVLGAGAFVGMLSGCAAGKPELVPSDDGAKTSISVRVIDNEFVPADIEIEAGQAVQWVFEGVSAKHDVVAEDGSFVSELMAEGTYTHVFDTAGKFPYDCSIHPEMVGTVTVK